ncbi:Inositol polyphosphate 5-phosphatase K [Eumeta japonica]|uniref:Inositol polyphosphate 5-phosphatase K n=1 Tax=Eumeta variegata TaxID=151549 RepID=A0A4C1XFT7_EUMVA|nr:Inositol polyphosphate 5-phosphatase K [Eumeta japonica]
MCVRTAITCASPIFAYAAPKTPVKLQVIQNKFCRDATDAHWCVRNSILHRDLELPTIAKFIKNAFKWFFEIADWYSNALLRSAISYEPPHPHHFVRRPWNVYDPPDALTAVVVKWTRIVSVSSDILCRGDPMCYSATFSEAVTAFQLRALANQLFFQGDFFSGSNLHFNRMHGRAGVHHAFFTSSSLQERKKEKERERRLRSSALAIYIHHCVKYIDVLRLRLSDLNFRTDHPSGSAPTVQEIIATLQKVEKDKYTKILEHDQLLAVMKSGEAFSAFKESEIRFPPTYKFNIGTDEYDIKRKPSWTDRILYKVVPNNYENVTLRADSLSYNHMPHYTVSDHKPVIGLFTIKTRLGKEALSPRVIPKPLNAGIQMRSAMVFSLVQDEVVTDSPVSYEEAEEATPELFANYTEQLVEFAPVSGIWYVGDADFRTQCTLSPDVNVNPNDWIGIFDANFQSLDDYIAYEYLAKVSLPHSTVDGQARVITLSFPVGSGVRTPGFYRFIYFSQPNNDVRSVLGISEPFEVSSKDEKVAATELREFEQASGSTSTRRRQPTTTADVFTDFTGLDVASLSRHFSNDLNID